MRVLLIVVVFSFFSCNIPKKNKADGSQHSTLKVKLDSLYSLHFNEKSPGAAILVLYDGEKIVNKGFGLRDMQSKEPITPTTNMRSGSIAKQFTSLGILSLIEKGKLSLNDTIYKFFPYPIFQNVTIRHFISHTSGIEDADWILENSDWDPSKYMRNEDVLAWYAHNTITRFEPGSEFEYNNGTYVTLAQIIEKVSGMPYERYIQKHVFTKAGMHHTQFIDDADSSKIQEYAYRYEKDSLGQWQSVEGHFQDEEVGQGGIYFSLNDFSNYIEALRNNAILHAKSHEMIFTPMSMNTELHSQDLEILKNKESSYTMGWEITDALALSAGLWNGTNNFVIYERKRPLTIVMLSNNDEFFKQRMVDKTYAIVNDHFKTAVNKEVD